MEDIIKIEEPTQKAASLSEFNILYRALRNPEDF
jgi:hypothetical protein